jgi:hypothetical protein
MFHVADLNARGEVLSEAEYTYAILELVRQAPQYIGACAAQIWRSPDEFEVNLPSGDPLGIDVRWRACAKGAGVLTMRYAQEIASLSLVASGLDPSGDALTIQVFQQHVLRELHDTGSEPGFGLLELHRRPLIATTLLIPPGSPDAQFRVALLDRCFAAAYFRYHGLA